MSFDSMYEILNSKTQNELKQMILNTAVNLFNQLNKINHELAQIIFPYFCFLILIDGKIIDEKTYLAKMFASRINNLAPVDLQYVKNNNPKNAEDIFVYQIELFNRKRLNEENTGVIKDDLEKIDLQMVILAVLIFKYFNMQRTGGNQFINKVFKKTKFFDDEANIKLS